MAPEEDAGPSLGQETAAPSLDRHNQPQHDPNMSCPTAEPSLCSGCAAPTNLIRTIARLTLLGLIIDEVTAAGAARRYGKRIGETANAINCSQAVWITD